MKYLLAKTLTSAGFVLIISTAAQAFGDSPFPSSAREFSSVESPATDRYFAERARRVEANGDSANSGAQESPFPNAAREFSSVPPSPALLRYFTEKQKRLAIEAAERRAQSNSHYIPTPRVSTD